MKLSAGRLLLFCVVLIGCKKQKEHELQPVRPAGTVFQPEKTNGILEIANTFYILNNDSLLFRSNEAQAMFFDTLWDKQDIVSSHLTYAGKVKVNETNLDYVSASSSGLGIYYFDTEGKSINSPFTWAVSGSDRFEPFTFRNNKNYPTYSGASQLQDAIYLSRSNKIDIGPYSYAQKVTISITDDRHSVDVSKTIQFPAQSVDFSRQDLSILATANTPIYEITLFFYSDNYRKIGNRVFNFRTGTYVVKQNVPLIY